MSIFNKYGPCRGITLYRFGKKRAEIWFIPRNYKIEIHRHSHENIELMFLFGQTTFWRRSVISLVEESLKTCWKYFGRCFSVKSYHQHSFITTKWPLIFINYQTFLTSYKPESAAQDFLLEKDDHVFQENKALMEHNYGTNNK